MEAAHEEPKSWDELYSIDLMPSELFLKFREQIQGFRLGLNLEVVIGTFTYTYIQFNQGFPNLNVIFIDKSFFLEVGLKLYLY